LQFLQQQHISELDATVFKSYPGEPPMARANNLPLVFTVHGAPPLERGSQVLVKVQSMDLIALDLQVQYLQTLDAIEAQAQQNEVEEDEELAAGPLNIAMDLTEAPVEESQP
jgi:exoribonuclease-2